MEIQSVGIKEFRANLHKYTQQTSEPTPQKQEFIALQEAVQKVTQLLATQGISEDELVAYFQQKRKSA